MGSGVLSALNETESNDFSLELGGGLVAVNTSLDLSKYGRNALLDEEVVFE